MYIKKSEQADERARIPVNQAIEVTISAVMIIPGYVLVCMHIVIDKFKFLSCLQYSFLCLESTKRAANPARAIFFLFTH